MAELLKVALEKRLAATTLAEKRAAEEEIADILRGKKGREFFDAKQAQTGEQE
jgi:hypothetical protein